MKGKKVILLVALVLVVIIFIAMAVVLQQYTLIDRWTPPALCLIPAIPAGVALAGKMRALTEVRFAAANYFAGMVLAFAVFYGGFYMLNFFITSHDPAPCNATIVNKYSEKRYVTRRVGRRTVGGSYQPVYFVVIELPDQTQKKFEISSEKYVKTRLGANISLDIETGLFGFKVLKNLKFPDGKRKQ